MHLLLHVSERIRNDDVDGDDFAVHFGDWNTALAAVGGLHPKLLFGGELRPAKLAKVWGELFIVIRTIVVVSTLRVVRSSKWNTVAIIMTPFFCGRLHTAAGVAPGAATAMSSPVASPKSWARNSGLKRDDT